MVIIEKIVSDIIPYENNAKKHDKKQIDNVAASIRLSKGLVQPLVIDKDNVVVIGHCRLLAAKKLKMKTVPCVMVEDLTPEEVRELRIADNKCNESEWIPGLLADEIKELDFEKAGFDFAWTELLEEPDEDAGGVEDSQEETVSLPVPDSRFFVFCVSAFGVNGECFLEAPLSENEAERFLEAVKSRGSEDVCLALLGAVNGL